MKYIFSYYILGMLFNNPLYALITIIVIYAVIDRQFIGLSPHLLKPLRNWQKARSLQREIELNPNQAQAYYELGALQVEGGSYKEARINLLKAEYTLPDHPDVMYYLGVSCIKTGYLEEGREALEKALALNPKIKYGFPHVYLIEYSLKKGLSSQDTEPYFEKISQYGNPEIYYVLGRILQQAGQKDRAREMFREAQLSFKHSPAFLRRQYRYLVFKARIYSFT